MQKNMTTSVDENDAAIKAAVSQTSDTTAPKSDHRAPKAFV